MYIIFIKYIKVYSNVFSFNISHFLFFLLRIELEFSFDNKKEANKKVNERRAKGLKHNLPSIINATINASSIITFTYGTLLHFANRTLLNERYHLAFSVIASKFKICKLFYKQ